MPQLYPQHVEHMRKQFEQGVEKALEKSVTNPEQVQNEVRKQSRNTLEQVRKTFDNHSDGKKPSWNSSGHVQTMLKDWSEQIRNKSGTSPEKDRTIWKKSRNKPERV